MEHKFSKGDRVTVTNPYLHWLSGKSGVIDHAYQFSGKPEYGVAIDGAGAVWVLKEEDLGVEDAS